MPKRDRIFTWCLVLIVAVSGAIAFEKARSTTHADAKHSISPVALLTTPGMELRGRNLSLQPEAFKLRKKLGNRFTDPRRSVSVSAGMLTVGSQTQAVQMTRRQKSRGERIEIAFASDPVVFTWDEEDGPKTANRSPNETDRGLIERLALDSADQFVLAQLRGASYHTVGRSVRPAEAGDSDSYSGPLWTIVRVTNREDPRGPESRSRLYFINESTGLIDRVVAEVDGEKIEATFSGWTSQDGETFPTRIVWSRNGQTIMEFSLRNFSRASA